MYNAMALGTSLQRRQVKVLKLLLRSEDVDTVVCGQASSFTACMHGDTRYVCLKADGDVAIPQAKMGGV